MWGENSQDPIRIYQLNTVTSGTASAPFLSTRVLKQLAIDEGINYPQAAQVLTRDFYADDQSTGASSFEEALACAMNS